MTIRRLFVVCATVGLDKKLISKVVFYLSQSSLTYIEDVGGPDILICFPFKRVFSCVCVSVSVSICVKAGLELLCSSSYPSSAS